MTTSAKSFGSKLIDSHQSYKTLLTNNNPVFNEKMGKIMNKNFHTVELLHIFQHKNEPTPNLFYFDAQRYNANYRQDIQDFIVKEIDHFLNNYNSSYAIVYVHSSIFDFLAFRRYVEKWPEHFFHRLRKIYILGASMMVRLVETFSVGTFYRLCDQIFKNAQNNQIIKHIDAQLLKEIGEGVQKSQSYKDSIKVIENEIYGKDIHQYELVSGRYPQIMMDLLKRLLKNPAQLRVEGIFRKSCNSEELQRLEKEIIARRPKAIQQEQDIFVAAGCLKKILNNLRNPIFNYKLYAEVINYQSQDEMTFIKKVLKGMEYVNNKVFILLVVFLNDYIIAQKDFNKMNAYNLAVIFGPCFFRPKEYDLKDLIYSGKFAKILMTIFEKPQELIEQAEIDLARATLKNLASVL